MPLAGLSLVDMIRLLRKGLGGLDSQDLPDDEAEELLNLAFWSVSDRFAFKEKECLVESKTTDGKREYPLADELDAIITVSIMQVNEVTNEEGPWIKLKRVSFHRDDELRNLNADAEAMPEMYHRRDRTITLIPTPDKEYPMRMVFWRTLASLEAGVVTTSDLPRNWDEMVVQGAVTRGHYYNQDYNEARQADNFQVRSIREAVLALGKEEKWDSRYAGLRVIDEAPGADVDPATLGLRIRGIPFVTRDQ